MAVDESNGPGLSGHLGAVDTGRSVSNTTVIAAVRAHHAQLSAELRERTAAVLSAAERGEDTTALASLCDWYRGELLPHLVAEEQALYGAGLELAPVRLLVRAMLEERRALVTVVAELALARRAFQAATLAASAQSLFNVHLTKENDLLLPALDGAGWDLATALGGMHEIVGDDGPSRSPRLGSRPGRGDTREVGGQQGSASIQAASKSGRLQGPRHSRLGAPRTGRSR
jgi:hypothetical protein